MFAQKCPLNVLITFEYTKNIEVHGFVNLPNRKCDLGRFTLDSVLGSLEKYYSSYPIALENFGLCTPSPPGISSDPPWGVWILSETTQ